MYVDHRGGKDRLKQDNGTFWSLGFYQLVLYAVLSLSRSSMTSMAIAVFYYADKKEFYPFLPHLSLAYVLQALIVLFLMLFKVSTQVEKQHSKHVPPCRDQLDYQSPYPAVSVFKRMN